MADLELEDKPAASVRSPAKPVSRSKQGVPLASAEGFTKTPRRASTEAPRRAARELAQATFGGVSSPRSGYAVATITNEKTARTLIVKKSLRPVTLVPQFQIPEFVQGSSAAAGTRTAPLLAKALQPHVSSPAKTPPSSGPRIRTVNLARPPTISSKRPAPSTTPLPASKRKLLHPPPDPTPSSSFASTSRPHTPPPPPIPSIPTFTLPPNPSKPSKPLKPLHTLPQPLPPPPAPPDRRVKPLSASAVSRAGDVRTSEGSAQVLAWALAARGDGGRPLNYEERELGRGLGISPEKKERVKGRFVRNGLAGRAAGLLARAHTVSALWHTAQTTHLAKSSSSSSSSRTGTPPDLTLHIARVLHVTRHTNGLRGVDPGLRTALVRGTASRRHRSSTTGAYEGEEEEDVCLLLNFSAHGAAGRRTDPAKLPGARVRVWAPWAAVPLPAPVLLRGDGDGEEGEEKVGGWELEEMPLPSPLGSAPREEKREGRVRRVLMCERFVIEYDGAEGV